MLLGNQTCAPQLLSLCFATRETRAPQQRPITAKKPANKTSKHTNQTKQTKNSIIGISFPGGTDGKEFACNAGDLREVGLTLGWEDPLECEMATHSSIRA